MHLLFLCKTQTSMTGRQGKTDPRKCPLRPRPAPVTARPTASAPSLATDPKPSLRFPFLPTPTALHALRLLPPHPYGRCSPSTARLSSGPTAEPPAAAPLAAAAASIPGSLPTPTPKSM